MVKVEVEGAKFSKSRLHLLVPVYEEGTVDIDLLNEGSFNMKDYLQQQGFFDATGCREGRASGRSRTDGALHRRQE